MRIGILGGSFDPIHCGHLILAEYAKYELKLDKIIFVPCNKSAYSYKKIIATTDQRISMLFLASQRLHFEISYIEIKRKGISYTIDTIKYFKKEYPDDKLILILGKDSYSKFNTWKDYGEIYQCVNVAFAEFDFYVPQIGISSTLIKNLIKQNKPIDYLVPYLVNDYIVGLSLYK